MRPFFLNLREFPLAIAIIGAVILGLWLSNFAYDRGVPQYKSRKIGHGFGGLAFLAALLFNSVAWPLTVAVLFGVFILVARILKPSVIRGVGGSGRSDSVMAELWFPWVAVPVFVVSWWWLNKPAIAVVSLLFMAWGDGVTGLVRSSVYKRPIKGLWGSAAMFVVCLVISWALIKPFWIGVVASGIATFTEWAFGEYGTFKSIDDNLAVPLVSLAAFLGLLAISGNL